MSIRSLINDYSECNFFELKYKNNNIYIYYYERIEDFNSNEIIISGNNCQYKIIGNKLIIKELNKEMLTVDGNIKRIEIDNNE